MMNLHLLSYNNYYNRIVKKFDTISAYKQFSVMSNQEPLTDINFNPNDGIMTEHVIGEGQQVLWSAIPDYLVVENALDGSIDSRWFIIEAVRTRLGQYNLMLRRDLFADYYDEILDADVFVEKGMLAYSDPFIFNSENMSFNQIKKNEHLLRDYTGIPWIVGYCTKDAFTSGESIQVNSGLTWTNADADETVSSISNLVGYFGTYYVDTPGAITYSTAIKEGSVYTSEPWHVFKTKIGVSTSNPLSSGTAAIADGYAPGYQESGYLDGGHLKRVTTAANNAINSLSSTYNDSLFELVADESWINAQNGKKIFATDTNTMYQVVVEALGEIEEERRTLAQGTETWNALDNIMRENDFINAGLTTPVWYYQYTGKMYNVVFKELGDIVRSTITFPTGDVRQHTIDAPYDVFCIPAGEKLFGVQTSAPGAEERIMKYGTLSPLEGAIQLASKFAEMSVGENTKVYDVQIWPYCPFDARVQSTATDEEILWTSVGWRTKELDRDYNIFVDDANDPISVLTWVKNAANTFNHNFSIVKPSNAVEVKVMNECDMWRLCSPNWNGQFEFNAAKNGGVSGFNIDYCLKPYQPYLHVNPIFGGLYGQDFNDARGLICGGDFSITQFSDAFVNYQMSNKNFQEIFDRQIQNMELTQSIERKQQIFNAVTGSVSGAAAGALSGAAMSGGNPFAAIGGAVIGGATSAIGGALDVKYGDILRNEALDLTKDQFGYQLDNIRAMPDSLTKVSSYNPNNKIFPVLEYYSCTDVEKEALRNKIKYNGMTVMRIDKPSNYITDNSQSYIKGKLIRLETVQDDFHVLNAISGELDKGVYIQQ